MSYRPITDVWILARSKVKYYGAYPGGFLGRARALLGVSIHDPVLHVCSGKVKEYPYDGFGPNDMTVDADAKTSPDFLMDVTKRLPRLSTDDPSVFGWSAILMDPPYSEEDQAHYRSNADDSVLPYPRPSALVKAAIDVVCVGGRVGILHTIWPRYPKLKAKQVALVAVYVGNGNRGRTYSVFEKTSD